MIKDKEYPATHSMSTSWFAIDNEGNVALLEFNENGPVPAIAHEDSIEGVIIDRFVDESGKIRRIILTQEQVDLLISCLTFNPFDLENIFFNHIVLRIDTDLNEEFHKIFLGYEDALILFSEEKGLYFFESIEDDDMELKIAQKLYDKKCVLSCANFYLDCVEECENSLEIELAKGCENLPIFIYGQEYLDPALRRIHSHGCAVKSNQLTDEHKQEAFHLPFSFREVEKFQIPFYYPSFWMSGKDLSSSDTRYSSLEIEKDSYSYVRTAALGVPSEKFDHESKALTFEPKIGIIKKDEKYILDKLPVNILQRSFELNYNDRSEYLKQVLKYYRPYLLILIVR